jgi:hypothetical protein
MEAVSKYGSAILHMEEVLSFSALTAYNIYKNHRGRI